MEVSRDVERESRVGTMGIGVGIEMIVGEVYYDKRYGVQHAQSHRRHSICAVDTARSAGLETTGDRHGLLYCAGCIYIRTCSEIAPGIQ